VHRSKVWLPMSESGHSRRGGQGGHIHLLPNCARTGHKMKLPVPT
jgi:hypothetical protein